MPRKELIETKEALTVIKGIVTRAHPTTVEECANAYNTLSAFTIKAAANHLDHKWLRGIGIIGCSVAFGATLGGATLLIGKILLWTKTALTISAILVSPYVFLPIAALAAAALLKHGISRLVESAPVDKTAETREKMSNLREQQPYDSSHQQFSPTN